MSGTKIGGAKTAKTIKSKHGADFYAKIGALGGKAGNTGGWYGKPELARIAAAKGGRNSKRGPWTPEEKERRRLLREAQQPKSFINRLKERLHG